MMIDANTYLNMLMYSFLHPIQMYIMNGEKTMTVVSKAFGLPTAISGKCQY